MSYDDTAYKALVKRYAGGRQVCNCGKAYYSNEMRGMKDGQWRNDLPGCRGGCTTNQAITVNEISKRVIDELSK